MNEFSDFDYAPGSAHVPLGPAMISRQYRKSFPLHSIERAVFPRKDEYSEKRRYRCCNGVNIVPLLFRKYDEVEVLLRPVGKDRSSVAIVGEGIHDYMFATGVLCQCPSSSSRKRQEAPLVPKWSHPRRPRFSLGSIAPSPRLLSTLSCGSKVNRKTSQQPAIAVNVQGFVPCHANSYKYKSSSSAKQSATEKRQKRRMLSPLV